MLSMKLILRVTATFCMAACLRLLVYYPDVSTNQLWNSVAATDDSPLIVQVQSTLFLYPIKLENSNPFIFYIREKITGISVSKVRSYTRLNDIHINLPLIQYKFPLSEHTEAG